MWTSVDFIATFADFVWGFRSRNPPCLLLVGTNRCFFIFSSVSRYGAVRFFHLTWITQVTNGGHSVVCGVADGRGGVHSSLHFYRRPGRQPHSQVSGLANRRLNPADFASKNWRIVRSYLEDLIASLACSTSRLIFVGLKIVLIARGGVGSI